MTGSIFHAVAAIIVVATVGIHVFLGGARYVRPVLASDLPPPLKWLSYLSWHSGTVAMLFFAAGFAFAAWTPAYTQFALIATIGAGSFVLLGLMTKLRSGLPASQFPVIPMFSLVTLLGVLGLTL